MSEYRNNVASAVSGTPGTGTITLGAAVTGAQSFATAYAANATVDVFITDGNAWEVARNCTYTNSGTTLTRGTLEASSTGAVLALTSAAVVRVAASAATFTRMDALVPQPLPFSTTVAFTQAGEMPLQTVAGAVAFTANEAGALPGVTVQVDLRANGTNVPTFAGFREWDGSSGYVNVLNVRNCITFFYRGGVPYYSINQQFGAAADVLSATAITLTGPTAGTVSQPSTSFVVGANGASITGTVVVTPAAVGGGTFSPTTVSISTATPTATFTYTPDSTGAKTISVTNNAGLTNPANITFTAAAAAAAFPRLTNLSSDFTETGAGPYGYTSTGAPYVETGSGTGTGGVSTQSMQSGVDASWQMTFTGFVFGATASSFPLLGIQTGATPIGYANLVAFFFTDTAAGNSRYQPMTGTTKHTPTNIVVPANGDIMRLRRSGTSLVAEVSKNSGSTWTTIYTWTVSGTAAYRYQVTQGGGAVAGTIANLAATGLV